MNYYLVSKIRQFSLYISVTLSNLFPVWCDTLYDMNPLVLTETCFIAQNVDHIVKRFICTWNCLNIFIFWTPGLSIIVKRVLKDMTVTGFAYFSLQFNQVFIYIFIILLLVYNIYHYYVLLMNWPIIIKWPNLFLVIFFSLKSPFSDINLATPALFWLVSMLYLYLCCYF